MKYTRKEISDKTEFDKGERFWDERGVLEYFLVVNMWDIFGFHGAPNLSQEELDDMAEQVIENGWHMEG